MNEKWSLWYDDYRNNSLSKDYKKNLFLISNISTIEVIFKLNRNFGVQLIKPLLSSRFLKKHHFIWWNIQLNHYGIKDFKREDNRNINGYVNSFVFTGADCHEFWKEIIIFFLSM